MSIATALGDGGQTSLPNRERVSKADLRVEAYGTIDELISSLGFARSICPHPEKGQGRWKRAW
jgi:cob(I)alamin adenosyltransferase